ncbi:hypothetical protein ACFE04_008469 [Oxalis oulophora]
MITRTLLRKNNNLPLLTSGHRLLFPHAPEPSIPSSPLSLLLGPTPRRSHLDLNYGINVKYGCGFSSEACSNTNSSNNDPFIVDIPLAQTGEGIVECELLKWFVKQGDDVDEFQPLCEVQSDKATIEITSRYQGKVAQLLYQPGSIVKVGETLLRVITGESKDSTLVIENLKIMNSDNAEEMHIDNADRLELKNSYTGGVQSTPAVRNLAKEYGINISHVLGSGKDGRVLKEDVLQYAAHKGIIKNPSVSASIEKMEQLSGREDYSAKLSAEAVNRFEDTTIPLRGFKRAMVKTMTMAAKVPHFHYVEEINCDALIELKSSFQSNNPDPTIKYTFLPIMVKSLSLAMSKYPEMNSCFDEESFELILKGSHNIGIAMATPNGLVVPNIKNVQSLSILEITKELSRLQQLAMENKLGPEDISGGTITLSNIGSIGGKFGAPIINLPEVSIIAIGRIQKAPCFTDDGSVHPVSIMTSSSDSVNIGADHRVLDGATVAKFCNQWKQYIENPELLMLRILGTTFKSCLFCKRPILILFSKHTSHVRAPFRRSDVRSYTQLYQHAPRCVYDLGTVTSQRIQGVVR